MNLSASPTLLEERRGPRMPGMPEQIPRKRRPITWRLSFSVSFFFSRGFTHGSTWRPEKDPRPIKQPPSTHTHTHTHTLNTFQKREKGKWFLKKRTTSRVKKKKRKRPHSANAQRNKNLFGRSSSSFWSSFFLPFWPQLLLTFFSENAPFFGGFFFRGPTSCCLPRSFFFSFFFFDVGNTFRSVVFFLPSFTGFLPDLLFSPGFTVICRALPSFFRDGWWWRRMIHAGAGVKRVAWTGTGV